VTPCYHVPARNCLHHVGFFTSVFAPLSLSPPLALLGPHSLRFLSAIPAANVPSTFPVRRIFAVSVSHSVIARLPPSPCPHRGSADFPKSPFPHHDLAFQVLFSTNQHTLGRRSHTTCRLVCDLGAPEKLFPRFGLSPSVFPRPTVSLNRRPTPPHSSVNYVPPLTAGSLFPSQS